MAARPSGSKRPPARAKAEPKAKAKPAPRRPVARAPRREILEAVVAGLDAPAHPIKKESVMKDLIPSLRMLAWMTLLCGGLYPLAVAGVSRPLFRDQADGSLVTVNGQLVGSSLIAQKFSQPQYFWPRPSAAGNNGYDPTNSGGSNLGPTSAALVKAVADRRDALMKAHPGAGEPPQDLLFASGSGLDPHISPEAARYQVSRVAAARKLDPAQLQALVDRLTEGPTFGVLGQARVNVLQLNLALDAQR